MRAHQRTVGNAKNLQRSGTRTLLHDRTSVPRPRDRSPRRWLFLAPEGSSEIPVRIKGAIDHKGPIRLEHAPFYWCDECPPLTHPKSADIIIKTAKWAAHEFKERFGLPLVLIVIDTIITAAGYKK